MNHQIKILDSSSEINVQNVSRNGHKISFFCNTSCNLFFSFRMRRRKSESKIIKIQEEARWQPADDLKLKTALEQVNDINLVHQAITFSSYFTSNELESRWNELLFNKRKTSKTVPIIFKTIL